MRIFHPQPNPTPEPRIYPVNDLLSVETWKAAGIVTAGRLPAGPLLFTAPGDGRGTGEAWEEWLRTGTGARLAAQVGSAREAAAQGTVELAEHDRFFDGLIPPERAVSSAAFGLALLEASLGARHMPEVSRFHRLVVKGRARGHGVTVLALRSVLFGITTVNTLVSWLFCEWAGVRAVAGTLPDRETLQAEFAAAAPALPGLIASWLQAAGDTTFQTGSGG